MASKLQKALSKLDLSKKDQDNFVPGILGFMIQGKKTVEVPGRNGYVYVRLRNNLNEVIQAYNNAVSPVYNLPVLLVRDETDKTRYRVQGRDIGRYQDWGSYSAYLPRHGDQHSFSNNGVGGGDVTWIYGRQFMPMIVTPSGSSGGGGVAIGSHVYFRDSDWRFIGETGTSSLLGYKPTDNTARMVLVYIDSNGNPASSAGSTYFSAAYTGTSQILPYIPDLPASALFPLAGIRLVSGTSVLLWDNIYDLRPFFYQQNSGSSGGGATAFTDLTDVPASYSGKGGWFVKVNAGASALEFVSGSSSGGDVATDAIWDAKGDLAVGTGPNAASRLAVGTDGLYLKANSATPTGVEWASVTGSSGGSGNVTGISPSISGHIPLFSGTSSQYIYDSGIDISDLSTGSSGGGNVTGIAPSLSGHLALFSGTSSQFIYDSGIHVSSLASGTVTQVNQQFVFYVAGANLGTAGTMAFRIYAHNVGIARFDELFFALGTAPSGTALMLDVLRDGFSILSSPAIMYPSSGTTLTVPITDFVYFTFMKNQCFQLQIVTGSSSAADLSAHIRFHCY